MAIDTEQKSPSDGKVWGIFKLPFRQTGNNTRTTPSSSSASNLYVQTQPHVEGSNHHGSAISVSSVAKSLLPTRRRLKLDPANKLYFPYEPGKQVRSAVRIKNTSRSYTAFKFQTTAPKSCFMRPPGAILAPGESIIATVFKFVEPPENNEKQMDQKSRVKFKIMSLKPMSMVLPGVVGFKLLGKLRDGVTATDLVLTVTQMLRKHGVVGKFVEFYGEGMGKLSLADRATIANMSPDYGATMGFFPVDHLTLQYLQLTGRSDETIAMIESYLRTNKMFVDYNEPQIEKVYSSYLELKLEDVELCISGA